MKIERVRAVVRGAVQGVGFRPFVFRLARELNLTGWVSNSTEGVQLEVEGDVEQVREFQLRFERERPPLASIQSIDFSTLAPIGSDNFTLRASEVTGAKSALILPDTAPCADCLAEILEPENRRHRYSFTNCTNCGPRFSIIEDLPYDRSKTTMRSFAMCPECTREYHDSADRRFHAQPNACPACGPQLEMWDADGSPLEQGDKGLLRAADEIRRGKIVALKGVGGFQLIVNARDSDLIEELRRRKHRSEKPFALMYPTLESIRADCEISGLEESLLTSREAPIVLLKRRSNSIPVAIAPGNSLLGVMLPSTPLHHLLLHELGFPVVATSGNLSDEPICIEEHEAVRRLAGIADFYLVHNRPIVRPIDDSVVQVACDREMILRRARGYAPLPIHLESPLPCVLAVGAHLKNAVALSVGCDIFVSQHIGDLETVQAHTAFRAAASDLPRLYEASPEIIACDLHPDYLSTQHAGRLAEQLQARRHPVQHHWAHVLSCMAENGVESPALGVAWDGTGYGLDGSIWGGEFLFAREDTFERTAHLRPFRLPGADMSVKQPRRSALGLLFAMWGEKAFAMREFAAVRDFSLGDLRVIEQMLERGVNAPVTTSAGRLFDAVAALIGIRQQASFEGQAAMELEFAVTPGIEGAYGFKIHEGMVDWQPLMEELLRDLRHGEKRGVLAAKFHHALAEIVVAVARQVGELNVVLTGGCFQNRYLTERCVQRLIEEDFHPYWHRQVPPNDGGVALGQLVDAARSRQRFAATEASPQEEVAA